MAAPVAPQNVQVIDCTKGEKPAQMQTMSVIQLLLGIVVLGMAAGTTGYYSSEYDWCIGYGFVLGGLLAAGIMGVCCGILGVVVSWCQVQTDLMGAYSIATMITCIFDVIAILAAAINTMVMTIMHITGYDDDDDAFTDKVLWALGILANATTVFHLICMGISIQNMRLGDSSANTGPSVAYMQNPTIGQMGAPTVEIRTGLAAPEYAPVGYQAAPCYQQPMMAPQSFPYQTQMAPPQIYPPPFPQSTYGM